MTEGKIYIVDSDVLITAKNLYYAFDICPGFWDGIVRHHRAGRIFSVSRVREELLSGRKTDELYQWVSNELPREFFLDVDDDVQEAYGEIMIWV